MSIKYIREHHALTYKEYIELLKAYRGKVQAITGKSDVQADYRKLEAIICIEGITIEILEGINHLLKDIDTKPNMLNIKKYKLSFKKRISSKIKNPIQ